MTDTVDLRAVRYARKMLAELGVVNHGDPVSFDAEWSQNEAGTGVALLLTICYARARSSWLLINPDDLKELLKDTPGRYEEIVAMADRRAVE